MKRAPKTVIKKSNPKKEIVIRELSIVFLTIIITPFYLVYRLLLQIPASYSPLLGALRAVLTFSAICWSTSETGEAFERTTSQYLAQFMANSLAELLVSSIGGLCCVLFFISVLILGGFNWGMRYDGNPNELSEDHPYPNVHRAMKDFDGRLGFGTIHGLASLAKKIIKK